MAVRAGAPENAKRVVGVSLFVVFVVLRALFASGVPRTWRLRLAIRSRTVRLARDRAEQQLRARLDEVAAAHRLRPVFTETIDQCSRAPRLDLGLGGGSGGGAALTGDLRVIGYFAPAAPIDDAVSTLLDRLPPRPLHPGRNDFVVANPSSDLPGPHPVHDGRHYAQLDWDIPGTHAIAGNTLPKDRHLLRQRVTVDPPGCTLEQIRAEHGPLIAWNVNTCYFSRPKRGR